MFQIFPHLAMVQYYILNLAIHPSQALMTAAAIGSGAAGGTLTPSVALGATLGAIVGVRLRGRLFWGVKVGGNGRAKEEIEIVKLVKPAFRDCFMTGLGLEAASFFYSSEVVILAACPATRSVRSPINTTCLIGLLRRTACGFDDQLTWNDVLKRLYMVQVYILTEHWDLIYQYLSTHSIL